MLHVEPTRNYTNQMLTEMLRLVDFWLAFGAEVGTSLSNNNALNQTATAFTGLVFSTINCKVFLRLSPFAKTVPEVS